MMKVFDEYEAERTNKDGAPERVRTYDLQIRSLTL